MGAVIMLNMASVRTVSQLKSQQSMTWVLKIIFKIIFNRKRIRELQQTHCTIPMKQYN